MTSNAKVIVADARAQLEMEARERILANARIDLSPDLIDEICVDLPTGNYPRVLAESLGVPGTTFDAWMRAGRTAWETRESPETTFTTPADPLGLRVELYLRVSQSEAEWEVELVRQMDTRITEGKSWTGEMTMLQRRKPDRWDVRGRGEGGAEKTWEDRVRELEADRVRTQTAAE